MDEVHALAGNKRGAHLALSLERLDALRVAGRGRGAAPGAADRAVGDRPAARGGGRLPGRRPAGRRSSRRRSSKQIEIKIVVPVEDMTDLDGPPRSRRRDRTRASVRRPGGADGSARTARPAQRSIWPHVEERVLDLIEQHRSTIVFANSRRLAERLCARLNELAAERAAGGGEDGLAPPTGGRSRAAPAQIMARPGTAAGAPAEVARAHHGSVSRQEREQIEEALKAGRLPAVVATSSLELGIDMGAVDLVIQVESPPSVAQRPAAHRPGRAQRRRRLPRRDLPQVPGRPGAVGGGRRADARTGAIEELRIPRNPLDVLAQQIVAMVAMDDWDGRRRWSGGAPGGAVRGADQAGAGSRAGHAGRPVSQRGVRRAAAAAGLGPGHRHAAPAGRAPSGSRSPAAAPSPTAACSACSWPGRSARAATPAGSASWTRRWCTSRGSATCSCSARARGGSRTSPPTRCWSPPPRASPAGCRSGTATRSAGRPSWAGRIGAFCRELCAAGRAGRDGRLRAAGLDELAAANLVRYLARAAGGHRLPARRPDAGDGAVPGRARATGGWSCTAPTGRGCTRRGRWPSPPGCASATAMDVQAMHTDDGIVLRVPGRRRAAAGRHRRVRRRRDRSRWSTAELRRLGAVRVPVPRVRRPGAAAAAPPARPAHAALAAAAAVGPAARGGRPVRHLPDRAGDGPGVPAGRVRRAGAGRPDARPGRPEDPAGRGGDARAVAVRPVAAVRLRRRVHVRGRLAAGRAAAAGADRWTPRCWPSCSARRPAGAARPGGGGRHETRAAAAGARTAPAATPRRSPTCCAPSGRCPRPRSPTGAPSPARRRGWLAELAAQRRAIEVRIGGEERWAAIEDAGRLRDALGVAAAAGRRRSRSPSRWPTRWGPGGPVRAHATGRSPRPTWPRRLRARAWRWSPARCGGWPAQGRVSEGEFLPGGRGTRVVRRRGAAAAAAPLPGPAPQGGRAGAAGRRWPAFLPAWQNAAQRAGAAASGAGRAGPERRVARPDAVYDAIEQLAGAAGAGLRAGDAGAARPGARLSACACWTS